MKEVITFEEAVNFLEEGNEVTLECDGAWYEISETGNWIGGDVEEGYISEVLGNVIYSSAEIVLKKSIEYLSKDGKEVEIIF